MTTRLPLPRSLYADTAPPGIETPPLEGETRADVVVVGGGFTGLSAALHLAEQGVDVMLLESNEIGWGASGRNGGQVNPGLKFEPELVEADFGAELGGRMNALSGGAPQRVFDLIERHQIVCEAHRGGTIRAAKRPKAVEQIRTAAAQWAERGADIVFLDAAGMAAATGTERYAAGMIDRRGGMVNPLAYARGLARAARQAGARLHGGSPALRMAQVPGGWRVETPSGSVTAERLALCTNGYTDALWPGLAQSIVPVFSMIAATEPLSEAQVQAVMPARSVLYEIAAMTVYYRVDPNRRLLMGGRSPSVDTSDPARFRYLIDYTERLFPSLRGVGWTHFWNGQLAISTDHFPHLHEPAPGVVAALAYNGRGVAMATAMGTQIAARLTGTAQEALSMPVTDIKPIRFHSLWRTGVAARVTYGRIRDSLGL